MSTLQSQVIRSLDKLSEDDLKFLIAIIQRFSESSLSETDSDAMGKCERKIGIFECEDLYDRDYDFDECNEEIVKMFGAG